MWNRRDVPPPAPRIRTIAVLPFHSLSPVNRDLALELSLAAGVIDRMGSLPGLDVRPLEAVRGYADADPVNAGRELNVDAVVFATMVLTPSRIRVSARLISVSDARELWQGDLDYPQRDVAKLQDSLTEKLTTAVVSR